MIERRHAIAHSSDYLVSGRLDAIDAREVTLRLDRLSRFIAAMDEILLRFPRSKLSRGIAGKLTAASRHPIP